MFGCNTCTKKKTCFILSMTGAIAALSLLVVAMIPYFGNDCVFANEIVNATGGNGTLLLASGGAATALFGVAAWSNPRYYDKGKKKKRTWGECLSESFFFLLPIGMALLVFFTMNPSANNFACTYNLTYFAPIGLTGVFYFCYLVAGLTGKTMPRKATTGTDLDDLDTISVSEPDETVVSDCRTPQPSTSIESIAELPGSDSPPETQAESFGAQGNSPSTTSEGERLLEEHGLSESDFSEIDAELNDVNTEIDVNELNFPFEDAPPVVTEKTDSEPLKEKREKLDAQKKLEKLDTSISRDPRREQRRNRKNNAKKQRRKEKKGNSVPAWQKAEEALREKRAKKAKASNEKKEKNRQRKAARKKYWKQKEEADKILEAQKKLEAEKAAAYSNQYWKAPTIPVDELTGFDDEQKKGNSASALKKAEEALLSEKRAKEAKEAKALKDKREKRRRKKAAKKKIRQEKMKDVLDTKVPDFKTELDGWGLNSWGSNSNSNKRRRLAQRRLVKRLQKLLV